MNIGYCCVNTELRKHGIFTSRGMRKATFESKGLAYAGELAFQNLIDLQTILKWNLEHNIFNFRISSELFPWGFEYDILKLPNSDKICELLSSIGEYVTVNNMRVTFHPSHFNVLGSDNPQTVEKTIKELNHHSQIFNLMGFEPSPYNCINIHVASTKPSKLEVAERFCNTFYKLNIDTQKRLTVENDDTVTQWSTLELYNLISSKINIPIVFDEFHYMLGSQDQTMEQAFMLACSTWKVKPLIHISSARKYEDEFARIEAHADLLYERPSTFNQDVDIDIECKSKEQGVFYLLQNWNNLLEINDMSVAKRLLEMNKRDPNRQRIGEALGFFKPKPSSLVVKKGDTVVTNGQTGVIIKYSSNVDIHVKLSDNSVIIITKQDIQHD